MGITAFIVFSVAQDQVESDGIRNLVAAVLRMRVT